MKKLLFTTCLLIAAFAAGAQSSKPMLQSIGVKVYPGAITYKQYKSESVAKELLAYFNEDGFRLTGLYEKHMPIPNAEGLQWYVGGGGHFGLWNSSWRLRNPPSTAVFAIGVDGVLGLDYKIPNAPLAVSFDWQPSFNLVGHTYVEGGWGGLAVRYTFK